MTETVDVLCQRYEELLAKIDASPSWYIDEVRDLLPHNLEAVQAKLDSVLRSAKSRKNEVEQDVFEAGRPIQGPLLAALLGTAVAFATVVEIASDFEALVESAGGVANLQVVLEASYSS